MYGKDFYSYAIFDFDKLKAGDIVILSIDPNAPGHTGMFERYNTNGTIAILDENGKGVNDGFNFHNFQPDSFVGAIRIVFANQ